MDGISISSETLDSTAAQVSILKGEMDSLFGRITQQIRAMNAFWQSPAANAAAAQFEALAPVFRQYTQLVENYCTYLRQTAQAYRDNEAALGAAA